MKILFISILAGLFLAFIGTKILFVGSALSLLPWALTAILLGFFAKGKRETIINGILFGFVLSFSFMIFGYNGARPLVTVLPFFALLGLFGALCATVLGFLGFLFRKVFKK